MQRKKLILNALFLTLTTVTLGFVNMGFRVYISNKIGAEGIGLYQLIMSIYVMGMTIAISGIRVTTTRLVAEELGKSNMRNIKSIMKKSFTYSLLFSLSVFLIVYNSADFIGTYWLEDTRSIIPIKLLSFSFPFVSLSSCFHGYFYGMRKVVKSVSADVVDVFTMLIVVVSLLSFCLPKGLNFTCALLTFATTLGNVVSASYFYILYLFDSNKNIKFKYNKSYSLFKVTSISLPIAFSSYIQMGLKTAEDLLIPNALRDFGSSTMSSLYIFGMIKGMALPILNFPAIFLSSFSTLIIPEIAESSALNQQRRIIYIISKVLKFTLLIAIFASGIFLIYGREFGVALYNSEQVGVIMKILAPLIPFMYLDRVVDGSLNALDQQIHTMKYNIIDMCVRITLIMYLIPKRGIEGFIIVLFVGTLLNSMLSVNKLMKVTDLPFQLFDWVLKPIISVCMGSFCTKYIGNIFDISFNLAIEIVLVLVFYFIFLFIVRCLKSDDVKWFIDAFKKESTGLITDLKITKHL